MNVTCRNMTPDELPLVLDWAAAEGWNPGLDDAAAFFLADPQGFFVAEHDGGPVAAVSVVDHGPGFAFLGLYICHPDFRGKGIGLALWKHALAHAGTRGVGLDGVAAQQANYARSGFRRVGSTTRFSGHVAGASGAGIRSARVEDLPMLLRLDAVANGYERHRFLSAWVAPSRMRQTLVLEDRGKVQGCATIRACREGAKIGPVIAPDADRAMSLVRAAVKLVPAREISIDLPESAADFRAQLVAQGFAQGFATARMYRGTAPQSGPHLQAIATMELG